MCVCVQSCLTLRYHALWPTRLLCPWSSPGKNIGVGCHFLLKEISPTQGSNLCLLHLQHWQAGSLPPGKFFDGIWYFVLKYISRMKHSAWHQAKEALQGWYPFLLTQRPRKPDTRPLYVMGSQVSHPCKLYERGFSTILNGSAALSWSYSLNRLTNISTLAMVLQICQNLFGKCFHFESLRVKISSHFQHLHTFHHLYSTLKLYFINVYG